MINGGNKIIKTHSIKPGLCCGTIVSAAVALELGYLNSFQERANRWII
jgi:hypothetical protein